MLYQVLPAGVLAQRTFPPLRLEKDWDPRDGDDVVYEADSSERKDSAQGPARPPAPNDTAVLQTSAAVVCLFLWFSPPFNTRSEWLPEGFLCSFLTSVFQLVYLGSEYYFCPF